MNLMPLPQTTSTLESISRARRVRIRISLGVNTMAMFYTVHHMIFEGIRPFDWLMLGVEVLVLVLIAYEVFVGRHERQAKQKRDRLLARKRTLIAEMVARGERLRQDTPPEASYTSSHPSFREWSETVDRWSADTAAFLSKESPEAAILFSAIQSVDSSWIFVHAPNKTGSPFQIRTEEILAPYGRLISQIRNLSEIAEKAELYF